MKIECAFGGKDILGEGPVWSIPEQALYWVDIERPCLQRWRPASGEHTVWPMPSQIGSFALRQSGGAVVALRTGLAFFDFDSGALSPICDPESSLGRTRFNDGKCDRQGRFWAGTMHDGASDSVAALYRLDRDGRCRKMREQVTVSNGLGWSPDNAVMYYTDTVARVIYAYDFEADSGRISNERIFVNDRDSFPDGLTVDSEGFVWSAKWLGWKVVRYAPDGSVEREIPMPVASPTSCTFGGPDMNLLYITSARTGFSETDLEAQPLAGSVLVLETPVVGLPEPRFAG